MRCFPWPRDDAFHHPFFILCYKAKVLRAPWLVEKTIGYCTDKPIENLNLCKFILAYTWIVGRTLEKFVNYSSPACDFQTFFVFSQLPVWVVLGNRYNVQTIAGSDVGRFAYKSIRIHRGRFANTILVDSHTSKSFRIQFDSTTLKMIRIHNLSRFAYKKVDSPTQSKFEVILCSEHYSRWLTTRARTFFLNIARIDKK